VAFVVETANLDADTVDDVLYVYSVNSLVKFSEGKSLASPKLELQVNSIGNDHGISDVTWSQADGTLYFIYRGGFSAALMRWDPSSSTMLRIGHSDVISFHLMANERAIAFALDSPSWPPPNSTSLIVTGHSLPSTLGISGTEINSLFRPARLVVFDTTNGSEQLLDATGIPIMGLFPSPDGRHVGFGDAIDAQWTGACWKKTSLTAMSDAPAARLAIIDLKTGQVIHPIAGPLAGSILLRAGADPLMAWSFNGTEAVTNLAFDQQSECGHLGGPRDYWPAVYAFSTNTGQVQKIDVVPLNREGEVDYYPAALAWEGRDDAIRLGLSTSDGPFFRYGAKATVPTSHLDYARSGTTWQVIHLPDRSLNASGVGTHKALEVREGYNAPPKLYALSGGGKSRLLMNLAPFATERELGTVSTVEWQVAGGGRWRGLLALPANVPRDARLPLILQTHGEEDGAFFAEGPSTSSYPGRAALARGFAVLTVYDVQHQEILTGERALEPSRMADGYRAAVKLLADRGLIDSQRVGIIGWSRTSYYVKYALTHLGDEFGAAIAADGVDYGYGQYLGWLDSAHSSLPLQFLATYGSSTPWDHLPNWAAEAVGFNVQSVRVPVRIEAISGLQSLIGEWEFYAGLRRSGMPVDLIAYPRGAHALVLPSQRMTSTEGALDWIDYWITGRVDPAQRKSAQYARWDAMRATFCDSRNNTPDLMTSSISQSCRAVGHPNPR
jgi:dipeptidyl aminopeptidase/acylaminoacyl peptidase